MRNATKQKKTLKSRSLSSKNTKRSLKHNFKRPPPQNNAATQAESDEMKAQAKKEKAAAAGANGENAEAKTEESKECAKES